MDVRDEHTPKPSVDGAGDKAPENNAPLPDAAIEDCAGGIHIEVNPDGVPSFNG